MYRCLIVADDLTGANASGVLLKTFGFSPLTLTSDLPPPTAVHAGRDALIVPTDSRAVAPTVAYQRVRDATAALATPEVCLYTKRIDSTLRGNVGPEIDAMLDGLAAVENSDRLAVVVPAYPQAGRVAVGGYLLVNGILLQRSDVACDPKTPVLTSRTLDLVAAGSRRATLHVPLDTVYAGVNRLTAALREAYRNGSRIVVLDALQPEDLETIADAVLATDLPFIAVDPGPFSAALAGRLLPAELSYKSRFRVLMVVGSVVATAGEQLRELYRAYSVTTTYLDPLLLLAGNDIARVEIERAVAKLSAAPVDTDFLCLTTNSLDSTACLDLDAIARSRASDIDTVSGLINRGIAQTVERLLDAPLRVGGLYLSGGDTTIAVFRRLGAVGLVLERDVLPLVAYGHLMGGRFEGMPVVTKGGTAGDRDATKVCARFLRDELAGKAAARANPGEST
ncbi:MAG: four-carbon acid sugar kinase family protein [Saprospiraceae bacterium]|nr:four-carbon acid sugar kinase family protein [Saprospiraceae bacterium]MCB1794815.1 four-carbon acid sugar kinase family protein [Candidatus Competibacteraceae bacterium]